MRPREEKAETTKSKTACFILRRVVQESQPTPETGEMVVWRKPADGKTRMLYNDPDAGILSVELG